MIISPDGMIAEYFQHFCQSIKISVGDVMQLGIDAGES